ncbi:MAG: hypothetical protein HKN12_05025, partial [Gemmatimonadetes bacterium]|nr:hypothetical protein [Gemmatimonadota bacterium]
MPENQPERVGARAYGILFVVAAVVRLAALRPDLAPAPPEALILGSEPDTALFLVRLLTVLAGSLAVLLAAAAGTRVAGKPAGWAAGLLLAVLPFALRHSGWVGSPALLLLAGAALSCGLLLWNDHRPRSVVLLLVGAGLG